MTISPYLYFNGNCAEAFAAYKAIFGGDYVSKRHFCDAPADFKFGDDEANKVMHVSLPVGETILMGADIANSMGQTAIVGTNFSLSYSPETRNEADRVFTALADGGEAMMAMQNTFWGSYFGMVRDRFGIQWLINFNLNDSNSAVK